MSVSIAFVSISSVASAIACEFDVTTAFYFMSHQNFTRQHKFYNVECVLERTLGGGGAPALEYWVWAEYHPTNALSAMSSRVD